MERKRFDNITYKSKTKLVMAALSLLICPGDDIALIASQINTTIHPDMPVAAMIQQEPKIEVVFDAKNLKG